MPIEKTATCKTVLRNIVIIIGFSLSKIISPESVSPGLINRYRRTFFAKDFGVLKKLRKTLHSPLGLKAVRIAMRRCIGLHHLQKRECCMRQARLPPMNQPQLALHL